MNIAIILAAGQGWRLQAGTKKAFVDVFGKTLLSYSLAAFFDSPEIDAVLVVLPKGHLLGLDELTEGLRVTKDFGRVSGAETRFGSLKKAIKGLEKTFPKKELEGSNIIIHNAANPLVTLEEIKQVTDTLKKHPAAGVGTPLNDTLRRVHRTKTETVDRENIWRMQTPQGLKYETLLEGIKLMGKNEPTDDLQLAEIQGIKPKLIPATAYNFKVTTETDLHLLEDIIASHREYKAGLGEDSHKFAEDGVLKLGGLEFHGYPALEADSDGDVMIHTLVTSLLQGLGLGSLGSFADPLLDEGITDSREYLDRVLDLVEDEHWEVEGLSFIFECLEPKIDKISKKLKKSIANLCGISEEKISIAAHTGDGLTAFARGEGIRCSCLLTLTRLWLD